MVDAEQGELDGFVPVEVKEIRDAAQKFYNLKEDNKDLKKKLKEKEDRLAVELVDLLKKHKQPCCQAGPYLITAEDDIKVTVKMRKEHKKRTLKENRN